MHINLTTALQAYALSLKLEQRPDELAIARLGQTFAQMEISSATLAASSSRIEQMEKGLDNVFERKLEENLQALPPSLTPPYLVRQRLASTAPELLRNPDIADLQMDVSATVSTRIMADKKRQYVVSTGRTRSIAGISQNGRHLHCICQCRIKSKQLNIFQYLHFRSALSAHSPSCPLHHQSRRTSDKSILVRHPSDWNIIGALFTFKVTSGVTGAVISRTLMCRRVVQSDDPDLRRLSHLFPTATEHFECQYRQGDVFRIRRTLLKLMAEGKVLPTDVDSSGLNWIWVCQYPVSLVAKPANTSVLHGNDDCILIFLAHL